ncbi:MAG: 4Fe-4S dicluster domain-containing protein [Desulfobacterales bacterium]|nr:4Fe-4S dicluster domain-containing protein [Desulfobacterales bacterium]
MKGSRRNFLKIAGLATLGAGVKPMIDAVALSGPPTEFRTLPAHSALKAARWAMVVDTRQFKSPDDFAPIIAACHDLHNVPRLENKKHEIKWIWQEGYLHALADGEYQYVSERIKNLPFLVLCNHCEKPPCVRVCPTRATFKRPDGIVLMDYHRCIGCRFCMAACPYGARSFNFRDPRPFIHNVNPEFPTRMKGVVEKCNFCAERLAAGNQPACVEASKGALVFGDLGDPDSNVRSLLKSNFSIRRKPGLGTGPAVFYIL